jgi:hypothetical protein
MPTEQPIGHSFTLKSHYTLRNARRGNQKRPQLLNVTAMSCQWRHIREPYTEDPWTVSGSGMSSLQYGDLTVTISIFHWHTYQHYKPKLQIETPLGRLGPVAWLSDAGDTIPPYQSLDFCYTPQTDETFFFSSRLDPKEKQSDMPNLSYIVFKELPEYPTTRWL